MKNATWMSKEDKGKDEGTKNKQASLTVSNNLLNP